MSTRNTIRTKEILKILRAKGFIKKWHTGKFRLMDKNLNPMRNLTRSQVDRLMYKKQFIKEVDGIYVYKLPKERSTLGISYSNYLCSFDKWETAYEIPGQTHKKAKAVFFRQARVENPEIKYTDIRCKKQK